VDLNQIATQFYNVGISYGTAIQPYALKLFFALLLIDVVVTWIQYTVEGQADPSYFLGRTIKHLLSAGFIYLMIVNAFAWMNAVVSSFSRIGAAITGLPNLSPETVLQLGGQMASTIFNTPASTSMIANLEIAIIQSICGFVVLLAFTIAAIALLFTLVESYIAIGGGVLLLGFGGSRFTTSAAEGYFPFVIRVGVRLLFYYLVLAVGVQLANQWAAAIAAACKPVPTTLPWYSTYGVPPEKIITTVCSGFIPTSAMLNYAALALVFAAMVVGIPHTVSSLVGGSIGLAFAHAFEAAFIARTIVRPISSALQTGFSKVSQIGSRNVDNKSEAGNWIATSNFNRAHHIGNLGPDQGPRVPAPTDVGPTKLLNGAPAASGRTASMPRPTPTTKI
jgi:type IV secretion system protein TrbL